MNPGDNMATDSAQQVTLPLLPLTAGVVVPGMVVNLAVESSEARAALDAATGADDLVVLVPRVEGRYATVGTVAKVEQVERLVTDDPSRPGRAVLVRGLARATLGAGVPGAGSAVWIEITTVDEVSPAGERTEQLATEYRAVVEGILERRGGRRLAQTINGITDPGALADTAVYSPDYSIEQKVEVLETLDVTARLEKVLEWARAALAELSVKEKIQSDVTDKMEKTQREYVLRQQLEAIKKELGEADGDDVAEQYRTRLAEKGDVGEAVHTAIAREIDRLERTSEQSPEHGWIRTWLDTMLELPWGHRDADNLDLVEARAILDADHTGLEEVKDRIVEQLAVRKLRVERGIESSANHADGFASGRSRSGSGAILTLVGPPGVGKTSLGESVAHALGRRFVRVALGGIRDEAEIRGFRRTYVGAQPGRIARAMKEAGSMNPVLMLDEVDKIGADWRGDPSAALLEVLDPAQNHTFRDHYLEVDLDLSDVLFIATANVLDTVPAPLLDRMEIIRLDGYTEAEKVAIARDHLLRRQIEANGLRPDEVDFPDDALEQVVAEYTREAGVRGLQREIGKVLRKTATKVAGGTVPTPVRIDEAALRDALGRRKVFYEIAERTTVPGVATGLAVTGVGGDVLFVEATASSSHPTDPGGLQLTGQLGDVMKESASIALSYLRSHAGELGIDPAAFEGKRFHVHVPAGAVPKDGPSAGVTMTTAIASLLTGRPVRSGLGMTGEVTLQGKVLPIGGVKQKVLAAHRAGLTEVALPQRNGDDLEDVPAEVRDAMTFHIVAEAGDLLSLALEPAAAPAAA
jgi:ATP-dependent Lon protease